MVLLFTTVIDRSKVIECVPLEPLPYICEVPFQVCGPFIFSAWLNGSVFISLLQDNAIVRDARNKLKIMDFVNVIILGCIKLFSFL
jgi:hypothetical protein